MTRDPGARPAQPPKDFQEYSDSRFAFRVWMPKRFGILPDTIDPLARMIRGLDEMPEEERAKLQPRLPIGFWDPDVVGESEDGAKQPLRVFEYEALHGREEPLSDEQAEEMWQEIREFMPETLASAQMPGYEFLGTRETALGPLPALAFEYRWQGVRPGFYGGDHARIVWAPSPTAMFHVYHHCSGEVWGARRSELDAILASFELLEPGEGGEAAARAAALAASEAALAASEAAQVAGEAPEATGEVTEEDAGPEAEQPRAVRRTGACIRTPE
jgi:hypothetical protein